MLTIKRGFSQVFPAIILFLFLLVSASFAESVFLKDGKILEGKITRETDAEVTLETINGRQEKIKRNTILRTVYSSDYKEKKYIGIKDQPEIAGYIVAEEEDTYTLRAELNSPQEQVLQKKTVVYVSKESMKKTDLSSLSGIAKMEDLKAAKKEESRTRQRTSWKPSTSSVKTEGRVIIRFGTGIASSSMVGWIDRDNLSLSGLVLGLAIQTTWLDLEYLGNIAVPLFSAYTNSHTLQLNIYPFAALNCSWFGLGVGYSYINDITFKNMVGVSKTDLVYHTMHFGLSFKFSMIHLGGAVGFPVAGYVENRTYGIKADMVTETPTVYMAYIEFYIKKNTNMQFVYLHANAETDLSGYTFKVKSEEFLFSFGYYIDFR